MMLGLGYEWHFHNNVVDLVCNKSFIGSGQILDGFIVISTICDNDCFNNNSFS